MEKRDLDEHHRSFDGQPLELPTRKEKNMESSDKILVVNKHKERDPYPNILNCRQDSLLTPISEDLKTLNVVNLPREDEEDYDYFDNTTKLKYTQDDIEELLPFSGETVPNKDMLEHRAGVIVKLVKVEKFNKILVDGPAFFIPTILSKCKEANITVFFELNNSITAVQGIESPKFRSVSNTNITTLFTLDD